MSAEIDVDYQRRLSDEELFKSLDPEREGNDIEMDLDMAMGKIARTVAAYAKALDNIELFRKSRMRTLDGALKAVDLMEIDIPEGLSIDKTPFFSKTGYIYMVDTAVVEGEKIITQPSVGMIDREWNPSSEVLFSKLALTTMKKAFDNDREMVPAPK